MKFRKIGSSLFSVGTFLLTPEGKRSAPQIAQISADVPMVSTLLSPGRLKRSAVRSPEQVNLHITRGALSLPEGAERVSRAAARLCERPRSPMERTQAPAGPENHGARKEGRSRAPPGAGGCFSTDRWRRSRGSLADRLSIGGPTGPGRQPQFFSQKHPKI